MLAVPVADFVGVGSLVVAVGSLAAGFVVVGSVAAAASVVGDVAGSVVVADFVGVVGFDFVIALEMIDWLDNKDITYM